MSKLWRLWQQTLNVILLIAFASMGVIALIPMFSRLMGLTGFSWALPATNQLVLWLAMLGAVLASRRSKHISVSLINTSSRNMFHRLRHVFNDLVAMLISGLLLWYSILFILSEKEYPADGLFGLPTWIWFCIIPFTLFNIFLEHMVHGWLEWHKR